MSHLRLFNVGDYVVVAPSNRSSGGTGWIQSIDERLSEEPNGVEMLEIEDHQEMPKLKYETPNVDSTFEKLSVDELDFLFEPMMDLDLDEFIDIGRVLNDKRQQN